MRFLFFAVLLHALPVAFLTAESPRPNILYFYVDDMGWGSIGPNGQAERRAKGLPSVQTPNLDRLAAEGVNFKYGYGCFVCSPARSSQQSGFHQGHTFADRNDPNNAKKAMRRDDVLMGDALSAAGYVTGYWGKWGYGGSKDLQSPTIDNIQTLPTSHGYQHVLAELHHVRAHTFFQPTLWKAPAPKGSIGGLFLEPNSMQAYQDADQYPGTPALQSHANYPSIAYCDDSYAFAALDFVRAGGQRYNESGQPFFGLLAVQIPHAPFGEIEQLPDWDLAYRDDPLFAELSDQTKQWAAMVTRIDAHFGNLLSALEDPNHDGDTSDSIADNTLVIFQSDNGGPAGKNNIELDANGGLTGNKGRIQEGGIRVPLVMRWPAKIHQRSKLTVGSDSEMVVDVTDLLPTFCELAGSKPPLGVDGVSIAPALTGSGWQREREFIIHEAGNGQSIIRGSQKLVRAKNGKLTLFDLKSDPTESENLAGKRRKVTAELEELLLGERVTEPKGFANTYHRWTGAEDADISKADNWSDYVYENAGVVYLRDAGPPRLSWVARMTNSGNKPQKAIARRDAEFLALEIGSTGSTQTLELNPDVTLTGRNEIRIEKGGVLSVSGGTVRSLRWVDVHPGGVLKGSGVIDGDVYQAGAMNLSCDAVLKVNGRWFVSADAEHRVNIGENAETAVEVRDEARIAGRLSVRLNSEFQPQSGMSYPIVSARRVVGRFQNRDDRVVTDSGVTMKIVYTDQSVSLKVD